MNSGELPGPFIPCDRAHKDHTWKPDNYPDGQLRRVQPADDPSRADVSAHPQRDNEAASQFEQNLPYRYFPHVGRGARLVGEQLHPRLAEHHVVYRAKRKRCQRRYDHGPIVYSEHRSSSSAQYGMTQSAFTCSNEISESSSNLVCAIAASPALDSLTCLLTVARSGMRRSRPLDVPGETPSILMTDSVLCVSVARPQRRRNYRWLSTCSSSRAIRLNLTMLATTTNWPRVCSRGEIR